MQMKIRLIISLFIILGFLACASKPVRSVTIFAIVGSVYDKESNFPLHQVKIFFIDTGFDEALSKKAIQIEIGTSDSRGRIDLRFNYLWFRKKSILYGPTSETFDIILAREGYETKKFHFRESELETDGITYLVNLENVYMMRASE